MTHNSILFYPSPLVREKQMRVAATETVSGSALIQKCRRGDDDAIRALFEGFWPFVEEFEHAIDTRAPELFPYVKMVSHKFGADVVAAKIRAITREVKVMSKEEGSHAAIWNRDADELGIVLPSSRPVIPAVRSLIDLAEESELWQHYAVLAGTEYIAEELSYHLAHASAFVAKFAQMTWRWGDVHLASHTGPSHREIDEDIARVLLQASNENISDFDARAQLERAIIQTVELFGRAADQVFEGYRLAHAA